MDALKALASRRSVRAFTDDPVDFDKLGRILEAAQNAPTAGNVQPWRIILVTDEKMREQIAIDACKRQTWISTAPVLFVVTIDAEASQRMFPEHGLKYARQDACAAITNILTAAHAQGLGGCWIGAFDAHVVARLLDVPDAAEIIGIVPVGHPEDTPATPPKFGIENIIFIEKWGNKLIDITAFAKTYAKKTAKTFAERLGLFKKKKEENE